MFWLLPLDKQELLRNKIEKLSDSLLAAKVEPEYIYRRAFIFSGRKSNAVSKVTIKELTSKNEVIYDPFMGSGTFIFEALKLKRHIIGNDIDSYSYFLVSILLRKFSKEEINNKFNIIEDKVKNEIMVLYRSKCSCGEPVFINKLFYDRNPENYFNPTRHIYIKDGKNIIFINECPKCKRKSKKFEKSDYTLLKSIGASSIKGFPNDKFIINSRINITPKKSDYYNFHFTPRAQKSLLILQNEISNIKEPNLKNLFQMCLVTSLHLCKITDYKSKSQDLYHLVDKKALEHNVWRVFEERFDNIKGLYFDEIDAHNINSNFKSSSINRLLNKDIKDIKVSDLPNDSVDMIITDPPYTDQVPYLERNQLFSIWLDKFTKNNFFKLTKERLEKEIIISDSPERPTKHSWDNYYKDMDKVFYNFRRVLKKGKFCILFLHPGKKRWFEIMNRLKLSARKAGFEPIHRIDISKKDPTMRKLWSTNWANSADSIIILLKLGEKERYYFEKDVWIDKVIYDAISNSLAKENISTSEARRLAREECKNKKLSETYRNSDLIDKIIERYFCIEKGLIYKNHNITMFDDFRRETIQNRILDWTPEVIERLLEKQNSFTYEDFRLQLSFYLDNGDKDAVEVLAKDKWIINVLKNYATETPNGFVRKEIMTIKPKKGAKNINSLSGKEFEELMKVVLENKGWKNVVIIGRTGDRGVDIEAIKIKNGNRLRYIFQCKRWTNKVGSHPIQRLHSYRISRNKDIAICITTSDYTPEGIDEAKKTKVTVVNGNKIRNWIEECFPNQYF